MIVSIDVSNGAPLEHEADRLLLNRICNELRKSRLERGEQNKVSELESGLWPDSQPVPPWEWRSGRWREARMIALFFTTAFLPGCRSLTGEFSSPGSAKTAPRTIGIVGRDLHFPPELPLWRFRADQPFAIQLPRDKYAKRAISRGAGIAEAVDPNGPNP